MAIPFREIKLFTNRGNLTHTQKCNSSNLIKLQIHPYYSSCIVILYISIDVLSYDTT